MKNKKSTKLNIIKNDESSLKNTDIENKIILASKTNNKPEVRVYFNNIPANKYTDGYENFCGLKIDDLVFYNPSLFDLYPKLLNFLHYKFEKDFINCIEINNLNSIYFSNNINSFINKKHILNTNWYINLDLSFEEILNCLNKIISSIYNKDILKVLTVYSIKT